jgi:hypothetical protein
MTLVIGIEVQHGVEDGVFPLPEPAREPLGLEAALLLGAAGGAVTYLH